MYAKYDGAYLSLDPAEAEAMKLLWRPTVRYFIYAGHASVVVDLIVPWLGVALLTALWLARMCLFWEIERRADRDVRQKHGILDWGYVHLACRVSRPIVISLRVLAGATFFGLIALGLLDLPELASVIDQPITVCLLAVAWNWFVFFGGIAENQRDMASPARAEEP